MAIPKDGRTWGSCQCGASQESQCLLDPSTSALTPRSAEAALRGSLTLARPFNSRSPGPQKRRAEELDERSAKGTTMGRTSAPLRVFANPWLPRHRTLLQGWGVGNCRARTPATPNTPSLLRSH